MSVTYQDLVRIEEGLKTLLQQTKERNRRFMVKYERDLRERILDEIQYTLRVKHGVILNDEAMRDINRCIVQYRLDMGMERG